jgi:YhcH/YjgK/YiaL family protein
MIVARLENAARYTAIGENIAHALHALRHTDLARRPPGRYDLADDGSVFALVEDYRTKPRADGIWEAHRRFIDVQFVAAGVEAMATPTLPVCRHAGRTMPTRMSPFLTARAVF